MLSVDGIPSENGIFQEVSQEVKNLQEDIKTGKFKNAYLLFGELAYLMIQYKEKLSHALYPDDDTMNFTKYEGKGIGKRNLLYIEQFAIKNGCSRICLDVYIKSKGAISFYSHLGFKEVGTKRSIRFKELIMKKQLD